MVSIGNAGENNSVRLWNADNGTIAEEEQCGFCGPYWCSRPRVLLFTPDGKQLSASAGDTEIRWRDIQYRKTRLCLRLGHEHPIRASPPSKTANLSPAPVKKREFCYGMGKPANLTAILNRHIDFVNGLAFSNNGQHTGQCRGGWSCFSCGMSQRADCSRRYSVMQVKLMQLHLVRMTSFWSAAVQTQRQRYGIRQPDGKIQNLARDNKGH